MVQGVCPGIGSEFGEDRAVVFSSGDVRHGMSLGVASDIKGPWPLDDSSPHRIPEQAGAWGRGSTNLAMGLVERSRA